MSYANGNVIPLGLWSGGIHRAAPVADEPDVRLYQWSIQAMKEGRYFVGLTDRDGGRVSTNILEYDERLNRGTTASGRVYELVGKPSQPYGDSLYVWNAYKRINKLTELDVEEGIGAC